MKKENLLKTIVIVAIFTLATSVNAQYVWRDINSGTNTGESRYSIFSVDNNTILGGGGLKIYKSTDKGDNWTDVHSTGANRFIKTNSGKLLAAGSKLSASTDNGDTWTEVTTVPVPSGAKVYNDIVKDNNGNLYMIGSSNSNYTVCGVYKSTDEGANWTKITDTIISVQWMQQTPTLWSLYTEDGNTIIVSGQNSGNNNVIRTTDGGATWSSVSGFGSNKFVTRFAKKSDGTIVGAAGTANGLYYSVDTGASFTFVGTNAAVVYYDLLISNDTIFTAHYNFGVRAFSAVDYSDLGLVGSSANGLSSTKIRAVAINNAGELFAASDGGQANGNKFHTTALGGGSVDIAENEIFNQLNVFPNPANNFITIANLPENSTVRIMDVAGRIVYHTQTTDAQVISSIDGWMNGMYFIRVESNGSVGNRKFIVQ